ncbi:hypothetical protein B0H10DRAFT_1879668, partial [Mycena sp. CBHHK59/15]
MSFSRPRIPQQLALQEILKTGQIITLIYLWTMICLCATLVAALAIWTPHHQREIVMQRCKMTMKISTIITMGIRETKTTTTTMRRSQILRRMGRMEWVSRESVTTRQMRKRTREILVRWRMRNWKKTLDLLTFDSGVFGAYGFILVAVFNHTTHIND